MFEHRWSPEANCLPTKRTPPPHRSARQAKSPRRRDAWPAHVALLGHGRNCNLLVDVRVRWSDRV